MDEQAAWAAGFFDGEGCVLVVKLATGSLRLGVDVSQIDPRPLIELQARWGGTLTSFDRKRKGTRAAHRWRCHGELAQAFLRDVRPYLRVKAEVADLGLRYPIGSRGTKVSLADGIERAAIREAVRILNRRGT